jgi:hypothetical protein
MIANFYIDAFNLSYGCLKNTAYKWLNLEMFCPLCFGEDGWRLLQTGSRTILLWEVNHVSTGKR